MSSMKNVKVAEALGALASRKLISVETKTPLREVLRTLHTNRILSVPVMENDNSMSHTSSQVVMPVPPEG
jgi:predicted transcriptional regulator